MSLVDGKHILITGGTGSLGKVLLRRLLSGSAGTPARIVLFSRDEAKQHALRVEYQSRRVATDDVVYRRSADLLQFYIGDIREPSSITAALRGIDIVFHAAALKQVPTCEYFPFEAVRTNVMGAENLIQAIRMTGGRVSTVVGVSTDKAVSPVNVMGMTKALQERILVQANLALPDTRFLMVRYGNVLASRASVVPLFHDQIRAGGPVTITDARMTRFLLSLDDAVDVVLAAVSEGLPGETYVPRIPAARITDVANALIADRRIETVVTGIRPGEKLHESLVSSEEGFRTFERGSHYVIAPILPELRRPAHQGAMIEREYASSDDLMSFQQVKELLERRDLMPHHTMQLEGELLR